MRAVRILFVFNHPAPYKVAFLNALARRVDLAVIFERRRNKDRPETFYEGERPAFRLVPIRGIPLGRENCLSNGIVRHLRKNRYDLVVMNGYSQIPEMLAVRYLKKHEIPYCLEINGGIVKARESALKRKIKTGFIQGATFYLSPDKVSDRYLVHYGADPKAIHAYDYSSIHESEIRADRPSDEEKKALRKKLGISAKEVFVTSGQLIARKNYLSLIKVWGTMGNDRLLLIAGEGKMRRRYEKYMTKNKINNVRLLGFLSRRRLFEIYRATDAFVFPSREDIYGHVINEALSQGLPVISLPNVNAARKLIRNGSNGYVVESLEGEAFRKALDDVMAKDMFDACIATAEKNTIEIMADEHAAVFASWEAGR